jgi:hypothetical protein
VACNPCFAAVLIIVSRVNTTASAASKGVSGPVTISYCFIGIRVNFSSLTDGKFHTCPGAASA